MLEREIKLKGELVKLLTHLWKDAQMAIGGDWDPTYDKSGYESQQILIEEFCKIYNINLNINDEVVIPPTLAILII